MNASTALKLKPQLKAKSSKKTAKSSVKNSKRKGVILKFVPKHKAKLVELSSFEKEELVLNNRIKARKIARSLLRKWHSRLDLNEVDSVVDLSLCEAVKNFNPNKGASFITFLFYHLKGNLVRAIADAANTNLIPVGDKNSLEFSIDENTRKLNAAEVAEALPSSDRALPDEEMYRKELKELSRAACHTLGDLEREVIEKIYLQEKQVMDVASELGYSRCHISRVKKAALEGLFDTMKSTLKLDPNMQRIASDEEESAPRRKVKKGNVVRVRVESVSAYHATAA